MLILETEGGLSRPAPLDTKQSYPDNTKYLHWGMTRVTN
jgi:hypothetical protein